jgi:hypothetical protein
MLAFINKRLPSGVLCILLQTHAKKLLVNAYLCGHITLNSALLERLITACLLLKITRPLGAVIRYYVSALPK